MSDATEDSPWTRKLRRRSRVFAFGRKIVVDIECTKKTDERDGESSRNNWVLFSHLLKFSDQ